MSIKKFFIYLWVLLIVAGQPLAAVVLVFSRNSRMGFLEFLGNLPWYYLIPVIIRKEIVLPDGYETVVSPNPIFFIWSSPISFWADLCTAGSKRPV